MVKAETARALDSIGQRIRSARRERGLTQAQLAGTWFTKSYISAIERNRVRPSLKALHIFARELDLPAASLLEGAVVDTTPSEPLLLEQQIDFYLDRANWLIGLAQTDAAFPQPELDLILNAADTLSFSPHQRSRFYYLRALAQTKLNDLDAAVADAEQAIIQAQQANDTQTRLRGENLLGWINYEQGAYAVALHHHDQCLVMLAEAPDTELDLQLQIYTNLSHDHAALGQHERSAALREAALELAQRAAEPDLQAMTYWRQAERAANAGDHANATRCAASALALRQTGHSKQLTVELLLDLVANALSNRDDAAVNQLLDEAAAQLHGMPNPVLTGSLQEHRARAALQRGQLAPAAEYARRALELAVAPSADRYRRTRLLNIRAQALLTLALVAEASDQFEQTIDNLDQALSLLVGSEHDALRRKIEFEYGEVLRARGEHQLAGEHYRRAYEHRRQTR